jgi:hypothetical protein
MTQRRREIATKRDNSTGQDALGESPAPKVGVLRCELMLIRQRLGNGTVDLKTRIITFNGLR